MASHYKMSSNLLKIDRYECRISSNSNDMKSTFSFDSLQSQKDSFNIGVKYEANVEIGVEGAKVTAPIESSLSYSSSKEVRDERNYINNNFNFKSTSESKLSLYEL
jgi:hypothetical protein